MTSKDAGRLEPGRYRVREARVSICTGYGAGWKERRFVAERRVVVFGWRLWWWPVLGVHWRATIEQATADAKHDASLRSEPYLKKVL